MFKYITQAAKDTTYNILRLCTNQYKYKFYRFTNHIRRGQKLLISNIWEDRAFFRGIFRRMRSQLLRHRREFILCATGAYAFDWEHERISLQLMKEYINEISYCHKLVHESIICELCQRRRVIDLRIDNVAYCQCSENKESKQTECYDSWQPFIERKDIIVWRKKVPGGMFVYKVYGTYNDVSAEDFLHVQTDISYRKEWDNTAVSLDIIDTDPDPASNSHIIYWEMLWPRLFSNRDYVYNRRYITDQNKQAVVIVSKSTSHPDIPKKQNNHRVLEYWSYMVIQSKTKLSEPGIEFVLTYFDNPGVSIPNAITSWVAMNGMPDFLEKLRTATVAYSESKIVSSIDGTDNDLSWPLQDPGFEYPPDHIPVYRKPVCLDDKESIQHKTHVEPVSFENYLIQENITDPLSEEKPSKLSWWTAILLYYSYE